MSLAKLAFDPDIIIIVIKLFSYIIACKKGGGYTDQDNLKNLPSMQRER